MKIFSREKYIPLTAGIIIIIISAVLFKNFYSEKNWFFKTIDFEITNLMFRIRGPKKTSKDIVIVDIDEKSIKKIGQWPWQRNIIAQLLREIKKNGAKTTGLDMFFPEKDRTSPDLILKKLGIKKDLKLLNHDTDLGNAVFETETITGYIFTFKKNNRTNCCPFSSANIKTAGKNIGFKNLYLINGGDPVLNISKIASGPTEGFINIFPESSGTISKVPLIIEFGGVPYPSLALELYRLYKKKDSIVIHPSTQTALKKRTILGISLEKDFIPTDIDCQMYINFRGEPFSYKYVSASDILEKKTLKTLKDKIVIIGTSAPGLADLKATPFSPSFPGVEVHAAIIDNFLNKDPMTYDKFTELGISYTIMIGGGILTALVLVFSGPVQAGAITILSICGTFLFNYFFLFKNNKIAGFSYPVLSLALICLFLTILNYFFKDKEKKFIQNAFSHYVSPEIVKELIKSPEKLSLSGETKNISVLFTDIRDFTSISESLSPKELGRLLNEYFTEISAIIIKAGGVVDKFIGDAVMAFFGAPVETDNHPVKTVEASFEILSGLEKLNLKWAEKKLPEIKMGIGINTGEVRIGNFGSRQRFDYTIIGDNVNLASRLEGLNKYYKTRIIISEFTNKQINGKVLTRKIDWVKVKGKTKPVEIFEPVSLFPWSKEKKEETDFFNNALDDYKNGLFTQAAQKIEKLYAKDKNFLYSLYLKRIEILLNNSPRSWDGVFEFKTK